MGAERIPCTVRVDPDGLGPPPPDTRYADGMRFASEIQRVFRDLRGCVGQMNNKLWAHGRLHGARRRTPRPGPMLATVDAEFAKDLQRFHDALRKVSLDINRLADEAHRITNLVDARELLLELEIQPPEDPEELEADKLALIAVRAEELAEVLAGPPEPEA